MSDAPAPWTTVARTTVVADRWIRLHADDCADGSGRRIAPYYGNHTNRVHHFLALDCSRVADQSLDANEDILVRTRPLETLGEHLSQSYHQLTWYKAMERIGR